MGLGRNLFSIMSRAALKGASFTSPRQLREAIDAFVQVYRTGGFVEGTRGFKHSAKLEDDRYCRPGCLQTHDGVECDCEAAIAAMLQLIQTDNGRKRPGKTVFKK